MVVDKASLCGAAFYSIGIANLRCNNDCEAIMEILNWLSENWAIALVLIFAISWGIQGIIESLRGKN